MKIVMKAMKKIFKKTMIMKKTMIILKKIQTNKRMKI